MRPSRFRIWGRRLLAIGGVAVILLALYLFLIRESSLFAVKKIEVTPNISVRLRTEESRSTRPRSRRRCSARRRR